MVDLASAHERRQAFAAYRAGDYRRASEMTSKLLTKAKNDVELQDLFGQCCLRTGRFEKARKVYKKLLARSPNDPGFMTQLGYAYLWDGKVAEAHAQFDRIIAMAPGFLPGVAGKADVYDREGNDAAVEALLESFVAAGTESPAMAVAYARVLQHAGRHEEAAALANRHLANPELDNIPRHLLCEMAAKSYEKLGEYDKAFASFTDSNRIMSLPFDPAEYAAGIDALIGVFSAQSMAKLPHSRVRSELPVFVASMPRTGSTLVEQIIHAHPSAVGAGELTALPRIVGELQSLLGSMWTFPQCLGDFRQEHADELAREYLSELRRHDQRATRIVNKHIDNYRYLGLIQLLCPEARVVHVKRHALDTCFSIFMAQMSVHNYPWSTTLEHIALAYRQYERLMAHWHEVLRIPILDVQYEDLVDDTETWIRRIIEFCGLPWDDRCLRYWEAERTVMTLSYDQVNKPIYKSAVRRYEKYEKYLGPLREALGVAENP